MRLTQELLNELINITSNAAIASYQYIGKNEKILADKASTDIMRDQLNKLETPDEKVKRNLTDSTEVNPPISGQRSLHSPEKVEPGSGERKDLRERFEEAYEEKFPPLPSSK